MSFLEFRNQMYGLACFSIDQVYAWQPEFNRNNLYNWVKRGLLTRLRQGWYTFPDYIGKPGMAWYFANKIYKPSYISLHSALAFYGIIPEAVVQITSITSLKTAFFKNGTGEYHYKNIKPELMFGYDLKPVEDGKMINFALPEKALLDLLYLYPEYNNKDELLNLRLDDDYLRDDLDHMLLQEYQKKFSNKALGKRMELVYSAYGL